MKQRGIARNNIQSVGSFMALSLCISLYSQLAIGEEYTVNQKNKQFSTEYLKVKAGDTVNFANVDSFFHNIFSLSGPATFDLGSYPQGESRSVTFEKTGVVNIECAIHPSMQMVIEVE